MCVAANETQLHTFLGLASDIAADKPVVVTKFIVNLKEIEFDAVVCNGMILNYNFGEYLKNTSVHSGDAIVILPAQKLYLNTNCEIKLYTSTIAESLIIAG